MVTLEELAETALRRESLQLRSLAQDFVRDHPELTNIPRPAIDNPQTLGTAAALLELPAQRTGQIAPASTREVGAVPEPMFLLEVATRMRRLRALCEAEAPNHYGNGAYLRRRTFSHLHSDRPNRPLYQSLP
jgi:hypothetical protein